MLGVKRALDGITEQCVGDFSLVCIICLDTPKINNVFSCDKSCVGVFCNLCYLKYVNTRMSEGKQLVCPSCQTPAPVGQDNQAIRRMLQHCKAIEIDFDVIKRYVFDIIKNLVTIHKLVKSGLNCTYNSDTINERYLPPALKEMSSTNIINPDMHRLARVKKIRVNYLYSTLQIFYLRKFEHTLETISFDKDPSINLNGYLTGKIGLIQKSIDKLCSLMTTGSIHEKGDYDEFNASYIHMRKLNTLASDVLQSIQTKVLFRGPSITTTISLQPIETNSDIIINDI